MDTKILSILILLMLAVSCVKQDHNNPFDSQCPKELWTPTDFKAALEGTTVKLTWSQSENRISGFKLTKKVDTGTETALTNQSKDANQLTDASLTGGKVHVYTLVAYAGNNQSNVVTTQITPTFLATVTTVAATSITANSAVLGGSITTDGGAAITERGICWATTANPTTAANKLAIGTGAGTFSNTIPGLLPSTLYYFRAYAINSLGTAYGNEVTVTMLSALPTLTTTAVSAITPITATSGGIITYEGISSVTARGVCWSTTQNPTTANSKTTDGTGPGTFSSSLTGLLPGTTYYIRAYATNSTGIVYGNEIIILTTSTIPTITTSAISSITSTIATSGGNVTSDGGSTITAKGICWSTTQNPIIANSKTTDGTGTGTFTSSITGLLPGTTYYVKAYATNSIGTAYGTQVTFTTAVQVQIPTLTTISATGITTTTATSGGSITSDGGATITAKGICWSTVQNPTIADSKTSDGIGTSSFSSSINGLTSSTSYYVRAYASNSVGTAYGSQVIFTTSSASGSTVVDIDGNVYNTVTIGTQVWMAENLKTTKYRNGDQIANVIDNPAWSSLSSGAYCWYNNVTNNKATYGAMYNWYAVADSRNIAPTGWHVATDAEWTTLTTFLGGGSVAGSKMKETGTAHWTSLNTDATNNSGFTALPGGYRSCSTGLFYDLGSRGNWWTSTEALSRALSYSYANIDRYGSLKQYGFSVRCVKD